MWPVVAIRVRSGVFHPAQTMVGYPTILLRIGCASLAPRYRTDQHPLRSLRLRAHHREGPDVKILRGNSSGPPKAAPNAKCSLLADYALKGEMQRDLQEPRAPDRVLDHTKLPPWRFASVCKVQGRSSTGLVCLAGSWRIAGETAEKGIKPHVIIRGIEAGVI